MQLSRLLKLPLTLLTLSPVAVVTGRSDGRTTEIVAGLEAGATVVVKNAFLLKAELGKAAAHHEH